MYEMQKLQALHQRQSKVCNAIAFCSAFRRVPFVALRLRTILYTVTSDNMETFYTVFFLLNRRGVVWFAAGLAEKDRGGRCSY